MIRAIPRRYLWFVLIGVAAALFSLPFVAKADETMPFDAQLWEVTAVIDSAAERWSLPASRMRCIAWRESTFRVGVVSAGGHRGVYQFERATWVEQAPRFGLSPDFDTAFDLLSNVELAAALMSQGQWRRWSAARWCA